VSGDGAEGAPNDGETTGEIDLEAAGGSDEPGASGGTDPESVDDAVDDEPVEPPPAGLLGPPARPQLNPAQATTSA